jgi:CMP-N-acetylneuraminic acid synthetase
MWTFNGKLMEPMMEGWTKDAPYHSSPTQSLPAVYVQNASLEIAKTQSILATKTISGYRIAPFLTETLEGVDINTAADFARAEVLARELETAGHGR